jgi:hypothetical protein
MANMINEAGFEIVNAPERQLLHVLVVRGETTVGLEPSNSIKQVRASEPILWFVGGKRELEVSTSPRVTEYKRDTGAGRSMPSNGPLNGHVNI